MSMNLASYFMNGPRIGVAEDGAIWDLRRIMMLWLFAMERTTHARSLAHTMVPYDMALFVRLNHGRLEQFREALAWARENRAACETS